MWLYAWSNDYSTIKYQIVIDKRAVLIKTKMLQPQNSRFCNIYFESLQAN